MDTLTIEVLVQEVQKELLAEYHTLPPQSLRHIDTYYQARLSDTWSINTAPHYHFWIDLDKKQDRLWIASALIGHLGGTLGEKTYFQLTEEEFLKDPSIPVQKGKNAFVILTECREGALIEKEEAAWARARRCLCDPKCPTFFLLASAQTVRTRFFTPKFWETYMLQLFRYRISTEKHFSIDYYIRELNHHLDTIYPGKRTASFDIAVRSYLEAVIPKASNEGLDFLEDLKKRVDDEYNKNHHPEVIDELCVPYYKKEQAAEAEKTTEIKVSEKAAEKTPEKVPEKTVETKEEKEPEVPKELLPTLPKSECGTFFDFDPDSAPVNEKKNILLLTLSIANKLERPSSVSLTNTPGKDMLTYYYQLEPVPYKLMEEFKQSEGSEKLDGILMICSPQTREAKTEGRNTDCGDFFDTAENYFVYKTSRYAKACGYELSYKEICTNIGLSDEASMKPEQRAKDTQKLIYDVIDELRTLKQHYPNLNIHVDTHGGFRTIQEILNTALSLLQMENIAIDPENIHAVDFISAPQKTDPASDAAKNNVQFPTTFFTSGKDTFHIMNFVTGIHECINYGQITSLRHIQNANPAEKEVLRQMQNIAEGIQLCDVDKFEEGLKNLSGSLAELKISKNHVENAGYLTLFQNLIRDSYGEQLLDNSRRRVIDEIKWCTEKGFIQQALTLIESKMPTEMIKNELFVSEAHEDALSIFNTGSGRPTLNSDFRQYLRQRNSPKLRWESVENYIVQTVGYTKRSSRNAPFVPMNEHTNYDALPAADSDPVITINNPKNDSFPERKYYIAENPKAGREINVFLRLHMQLKEERNKTNHAGNDSDRHSLTIILHALEAYIRLYEKIMTALNQ